MANSINKKLVSPVMESGHGHIFHAAGTNFKVTGNHIETIEETNDVFNTLVFANETFNITENTISFYYDYNNKQIINKVEEGAEENFETLLTLTEKVDFLEAAAKELRLAGNKGEAIAAANTELNEAKSALEATKSMATAIKFTFANESNTIKAGSIEIALGSEESLAERCFTIGYIKYQDKPVFEAFQIATKHFDTFKVLDFVSESTQDTVTLLAMRAENNAFVFRTNEATRISKLVKTTVNSAITMVAEETGADVANMFTDLLEAAAEAAQTKEQTKALYKEMLSFLYDQKGRLAEADRNLPDIKAADNLISSEIKRISEDLAGLDEETLGIEDGYVSGSLKAEVDGLSTDASLKVDAVEFNQAGKNDILTVFSGDKPYRVEKFKINISTEDSV